MTEREWVQSILPRIKRALAKRGTRKLAVEVVTGHRLPYTCEVTDYEGEEICAPRVSGYETDILVRDRARDGRWTPRVVIECKLRKISTHDALTYSSKAATHKQVHPYLRYGILIGERKRFAIPGRLVRHGAHFDFMATWVGVRARPLEWRTLVSLIADEIRASRTMQTILASSRQPSRTKYVVLHRPLRFKRINRGTASREEADDA
ncbi:MAG: hypothetical protein ACYS6Z_16585 [Planctomycetota bacterium]|jgi:hypothetical protein